MSRNKNVGSFLLSNDEIQACRDAFRVWDEDFSDSIDVHELGKVMKELGQTLSHEEVARLMSSAGIVTSVKNFSELRPHDGPVFKMKVGSACHWQVDLDSDGKLSFLEFIRMVEERKEATPHAPKEQDAVDAFLALGGNDDLTGEIEIGRLKQVLDMFELTASVKDLTKAADQDKDGTVDYKELKNYLLADN